MVFASTAIADVAAHYLALYKDNNSIHTAARCKLEIKFTGHVDSSRVNFSADCLLQQQKQRSDAPDAVYHGLPTPQTVVN